jgi:N-acetyl-gamma-glutamyl-phosphate reductase
MVQIGIVGASGYSGVELLRLLSTRSDVNVSTVVASTSAGKRVDEVYPAFSHISDHAFEAYDPEQFKGLDVVFVALPSGEGMRVVPQLMGRVDRIIDLGGDFRLADVGLYEKFYGRKHMAIEFLCEAVYGLPELNRGQITSARLVANPGCYPTSALLPLLPMLKAGIVSARGIVINSLSGVSGAGRSASFEMSFAEVNENIRAYKVGNHQHIPEIQSVLERATGEEVSLSFVPHLLPLTRGIYTTIHAELATSCSAEDIRSVYSDFYADAPFVRVRHGIPQIKDVTNSNFCDIGFTVEPRTNQLIILSTIDNLVKGAAGQAIQNMNIMLGLPEETGLLRKELQHA